MGIKYICNILSAFLIFCFSNSYAQIEQKYSSSNQPYWVQLMYSEGADVGVVLSEYKKYYNANEFVKNQHTQYFKHWLHEVQRANHSNGSKEEGDYIEQSLKLRNSKSPTSPWQCIGPWDFDKEAASRSYAPGAAHIYTIERAVTDTSVLYAGTATAGLWKTTDGGDNWDLLTRDLMLTRIFAIEIDHSNHNIVYFESGGNIYKTTDGGNNWSIIGDPVFQSLNHDCKDIVVDPANSNVIYLTSDQGFFRSSDAGDNWTEIDGTSHQEIEIHPTLSNIVYTVRQSGNATTFWKSVDGGLSFNQQTIGWPVPLSSDEQKRTEIAVCQAAPDYVYALCTGEANGGSGLYGIYVSKDQGQTWTFRCCGGQPAGVPSLTNMNLMAWAKDGTEDGGQYYYDVALDVDPNDSAKIHVGGVNHWISTDGGYNFNCPATWAEPGEVGYVHADIHDIRFFGSELWIACDGGVFYSMDKGQNIDRRMYGIEGSDFWGFGVSFQGGEVMLGGAYHNGTLLKDNNVYDNDWICTGGGDGMRGFVNQGESNRVVDDWGGRTLSGDRSIANGTFQFDSLPNASYIVGMSSNLIPDPRCNNHLYIGRNTKLLKSTDFGSTYSEIYDFGDDVIKIQIAWTDPDIMYVVTYSDWWGAKKVWRTVDAGQNWTEITPSSTDFGGNMWIPLDIAVSSNDANTLWLARTSYYGGGADTDGKMVFKTEDGGQSWTNITTSTLDGEGITNIVHQRGTNGGVYIGTRRAVYYKNNSLSDWQLFNVDLPINCHSTKLVPNYDNEKLRNATSRSVYEVDFYENSLPQAQISANRLSANCFNNEIQFFDYSSISSNNPTWSWSFPGGTPSSSTDRNPIVVYSNPGSYDVSLTITDDYGSSSQSYSDFITYVDPIVNYDLVEDFENGFDSQWILKNEDNTFNWSMIEINNGSDCQPTYCATVNHYDIDQSGDEAELITPYIDLDNVSGAKLFFDYAYAKYGGTYEDGFRIDVTTNCGVSWDKVFEAFGDSLETVEDQGSWWEPTDCQDWRVNNEVNLSAYDGEQIMIRFVAINGYGNNFYLDNINVDGQSLNVKNTLFEEVDIKVYPNPSNGNLFVRHNSNEVIELKVLSTNGALLLSKTIVGNYEELELPLVNGVYQLHFVVSGYTKVERLIISK